MISSRISSRSHARTAGRGHERRVRIRVRRRPVGRLPHRRRQVAGRRGPAAGMCSSAQCPGAARTPLPWYFGGAGPPPGPRGPPPPGPAAPRSAPELPGISPPPRGPRLPDAESTSGTPGCDRDASGHPGGPCERSPPRLTCTGSTRQTGGATPGRPLSGTGSRAASRKIRGRRPGGRRLTGGARPRRTHGDARPAKASRPRRASPARQRARARRTTTDTTASTG